jgi:tetratricopeptide (TPR) repeat protein
MVVVKFGISGISGVFAKSGISGLLIEKIPLIVISVLFGFVALHAQGRAVVRATAFSMDRRIANALLSYVVYVREIVWPANLCVFYPVSEVHPAKAVSCALALAAITAAVLYYAKRLRWLPVGWFWYLGTLVPVIGLVQVGMQARADRYLYVPRIGLFIAAAWGLYRFAEKYDVKKTAAVSAALVVITFSALTYAQAGHWKNNKTLYEHCLAVTDGNFIVLQSLGHDYLSKGDLDKAAECFEKSIEAKPDDAPGYLNLGNVLKKRGDVAGALARYETAIKFAPNYGDAHNNIANIQAAAGRFDQACKHHLLALQDKPESADINCNYANTLLAMGRAEEAVDYYRRALEIQPDLLAAHNNLGYALASMGKTDEAEAHLTRAVEINPDLAQARYMLGLIFLDRRDSGRAEAHLEKAVELNPGFDAAHNALGVALVQLGRTDEAALHFRRAVEINPGFVEAVNNLAELSQKPRVK